MVAEITRSKIHGLLVIRDFNSHVFFGVALTGEKKQGRYYVAIGEVEGSLFPAKSYLKADIGFTVSKSQARI